MPETELTDLLRREADEHPLDRGSSERILRDALAAGARRRRGRRLAVGACAAAAATVVVGSGLALGDRDGGTTARDPAASTGTGPVETVGPGPADPEPTYAEGSATEVPGGPVVATDRRIADERVLAAVARDLLPPDGVVADLRVEQTATSIVSHRADRTREGRLVSFTLDGAGASVTLQRWDGYAAVGVASLPGPGEEEPERKAATTAREACAGAYRSFPPIECTPTDGGWYSQMRPSQGAAMPDTYQELLVALYTDDGYVVVVDSYNTSAEKSGELVADQPVLDPQQSLAIAGSPRWFVTGQGRR
ncbi:hypothetical protein AB0N29_04670 [Nocardioides sp. NPDC092400]|uniref:hypothetical protein n=1 Tax=Nocardioides sp. NPDC092400 TaxID=3155196 RepID=UPI003418AB2D